MFRKLRSTIFPYVVVVLATGVSSCVKEEVTTHETRLKAPVRTYTVTSRIDKKEANNDSEATGILKGNYDESSKVFKYRLSFEGVEPKAIAFKQGQRGKAGTLIWAVHANNGQQYKTPLVGEKVLTALEERYLLRGAWFITIDSKLRTPEIRGIITLK